MRLAHKLGALDYTLLRHGLPGLDCCVYRLSRLSFLERGRDKPEVGGLSIVVRMAGSRYVVLGPAVAVENNLCLLIFLVISVEPCPCSIKFASSQFLIAP
jgi:hypothetical protein